MRIAMLPHLASRTAPTGAERSLAQLATGLARRGHQVLVAAPDSWALAGELRAAGVTVDTVPYRSLWLTAPTPQPLLHQAIRVLRFATDFRGPRRLERWILEAAPDVVYVNCLPNLRGAATAARLGRPVLWHLREILPAGRRRRWFAGRVAAYADRVVAVSRAVAAWLEAEQVSTAVSVVHNGVAPPAGEPSRAAARERLGLDPELPTVGFFAQLLPHKGALEVVAAVGEVQRSGVPLQLLAAGAGDHEYLRRVEQTARRSPRPDLIRLLPPTVDVQSLLAAVDVVAVATLTPDPLPRTVLEGMAASLPVVAFRGGGVDEMVVDGATGRLVAAGDVAALAGALRSLALDPATRAHLGRAGRRRVEALFSLDGHVERMEKLLAELATGRDDHVAPL